MKLDDSDNTIGKKIRIHRKMRPAYMVIIGDDEEKNRTVSIRARDGQQKNDIPLNDFIADIFAEITNRSKTLDIV